MPFTTEAVKVGRKFDVLRADFTAQLSIIDANTRGVSKYTPGAQKAVREATEKCFDIISKALITSRATYIATTSEERFWETASRLGDNADVASAKQIVADAEKLVAKTKADTKALRGRFREAFIVERDMILAKEYKESAANVQDVAETLQALASQVNDLMYARFEGTNPRHKDFASFRQTVYDLQTKVKHLRKAFAEVEHKMTPEAFKGCVTVGSKVRRAFKMNVPNTVHKAQVNAARAADAVQAGTARAKAAFVELGTKISAKLRQIGKKPVTAPVVVAPAPVAAPKTRRQKAVEWVKAHRKTVIAVGSVVAAAALGGSGYGLYRLVRGA